MDNSAMEAAVAFLGQFSREEQLKIIYAGTEGQLPDRRNALRRALLEALDELIPENTIAFLGSPTYQSIIEMIENPALPMPELAKTALEHSIRWSNKKVDMEATISFLTSFSRHRLIDTIYDMNSSDDMRLHKAFRRARVTHLRHHPPADKDYDEPDPLFQVGLQNGYVATVRNAVQNELRVTGHNFGTIHTRFPLVNRQIEGQYQTPLVKIAERFYRGGVNADASLQAFEFLLDRGAKVDIPSASDLPESSVYYASSSMLPVVDHLTEMMKWINNRKVVATLCKMVELACQKGAILDLCQDRFMIKGSKYGLKMLTHIRTKRPDNLIEIALQPQCPPNLLRLFLEQQGDELFPLCQTDGKVKVARRFNPNMPRGHHRAVTNLEWVITSTYHELMDRSNVHGYKYSAEPGDLFIRKAQMLMHAAVDGPTLEGLHKLILGIESIKKELKVKHESYEAFKAHSWYVLCDAMSYFANQPSQEEQIAKQGEPRHKFIVADRWDPRKEWIRMTQIVPDIAEEDEWEGFLEFWEQLVISRGEGQRWYELHESKWFVSIEEAEEAFKIANPEGAFQLHMF
ncbi:uncharacterized protein NECHADRAFT_87282 [Fusarium vanettenii 77-13-4]|uniref:Uncharacterized protein n=1 Tax=Fusarium vanettenii (strain ATCC MYA-4622 / CBS 123669 / FGSC 9596 / NRRL 45880 / 77-13-4) TaxID=660122 RepID=C7ZIW0_FUSV7|nr:uncharacterized protein NECHADRAFT_87282 [Fusarium vanettenii 77-13-4]EEU36155.1 hypothetical protein NECHADRAFT_87282 [Fusarium vanettenii 77-13-4]